MEFAGHAAGRTESGASVSLIFDGGMEAPVAKITSPQGEIVIDEAAATASGTMADAGMHVESPMVSRISTLAVPDILAGQTVLPDLAATASMNRLMIEAAGRALFGVVKRNLIVPIT